MDLLEMSALELGAAIKEKKVSVREAVLACLHRIEKTEPDIHAFITVTPELALERADIVQRGIDSGEYTHPLAGVPMAVKDLISTKGVRTTCASRMLADYVPAYHAHVMERLEEIGAVCIGKTNMDEFAMGSTTETSWFGKTCNPWNLDRVPGGSSGGSAAAVAARSVYYALGSDTGGSIRQPASFCGITGLKPTYGMVSRYGLIAYASSLDQIGPMTRDARDAAAVLSVLAGKDGRDGTSVESGPVEIKTEMVRGMRIGVPEECFSSGVEPMVRERVMAAMEELKRAGAVPVPVQLSMLNMAVPAYYVLACAEASSNLSRYDGLRYGYHPEAYEDLRDYYLKSRSEGFGTEVKRRIMLGTFALSAGFYDAYYDKALRVKQMVRETFLRVFEQANALLMPAAPTTAYPFGAASGNPIEMYLGDIFTVSVNLAGLPGLSFPCGLDADGLPVGAQLVGPAFSESRLLSLAAVYQERTAEHLRKPEV